MSVLIDYSSGAFETNKAQGVGTVTAGAGDVDFADVSLLLHMDGSNGSTTITDSSSNSVSVTAYGNAQLSTTEKKFGTASAYFDGNSDELRFAAPALNGDFTAEAFIYPESQVQDYPICFGPVLDNTINNRILLSYDHIEYPNKFSVRVGNNFVQTSSTIATGQFYHVAVVRSGSSVSLFVDGVSAGSQTYSGTSQSRTEYMGGNFVNNTNGGFKGYIDEFRLTNGVARYTSNFTPPSVAFPDGTSGPINLDISSGTYFNYTPTANTTFTFGNAPASGTAAGFALAVTGANAGETYDIANASYDSVSLSVGSVDTTPVSLAFNNDGTKFYFLGDQNEKVYQYSCSTAYDISTATKDTEEASVNTQVSSARGFNFNNDGTKFFVSCYTNDAIYEYDLSTAFDVSTASYSNTSLSISVGSNGSHCMSSNGLYLYTIDEADDVDRYTLSTAWDLSTATYSDTKDDLVETTEASPSGIFISPDGTKLFIGGYTGDVVTQSSLSTAYDITTASYDSISFSIASQDGVPYGLFFKPDGTKMYIAGLANSTIYQYTTGSSATATFSYPASVEWPSGTAPDGPAIGETDVLVFLTDDGGTSYQGFQAGDAMS